jgi:hypothetical protein
MQGPYQQQAQTPQEGPYQQQQAHQMQGLYQQQAPVQPYQQQSPQIQGPYQQQASQIQGPYQQQAPPPQIIQQGLYNPQQQQQAHQPYQLQAPQMQGPYQQQTPQMQGAYQQQAPPIQGPYQQQAPQMQGQYPQQIPPQQKQQQPLKQQIDPAQLALLEQQNRFLNRFELLFGEFNPRNRGFLIVDSVFVVYRDSRHRPREIIGTDTCSQDVLGRNASVRGATGF